MKCIVLIASLMIIVGQIATGQHIIADTFYIDRVLKTPSHPYYGLGSEYGLTTNGVEGATWYMIRDSLYAINYGDLKPWFVPRIGSSPRGLPEDDVVGYFYDDQTQNDIWIYQVSDWAPDTLYYINGDDLYCGGMILVLDSATSHVEESARTNAQHHSASFVSPNPLSSDGMLRLTLAQPEQVCVEMCDVLGRVVQRLPYRHLMAGTGTVPLSPNGLASGVYFYRVLDEEERVISTGTFHVR